MTAEHQATVALRWILPFLRVTGADPLDLPLLLREGITVRELVRPETRIRHGVMMELLGSAVERRRDARLGLQAGEALEPGDMDVLEYAARSCANLRDAIECANRYMALLHGGQTGVLREEGALAAWELHDTDRVARHHAANDFALTAACWFARRYTSPRPRLNAVHFRHPRQPSLDHAYQRVFGAPIYFQRPCNALVFPRAELELPMLYANAGFQAAFEERARALCMRLGRLGL
jgi:hypothetical protein